MFIVNPLIGLILIRRLTPICYSYFDSHCNIFSQMIHDKKYGKRKAILASLKTRKNSTSLSSKKHQETKERQMWTTTHYT
jgi:hypothetical protein